MKRLLIGVLVAALLVTTVGCTSPETPTITQTQPGVDEFEFPNVTPPSPISLDNLDPKFVRPVAGRKLWEHYKVAKPTTVKINHVVSPSYPKEIYEGSLETFQAASDFFGDVGDLSTTYIFWITPKDADWINKQMCDVAKYCAGGKRYHDIGASMKQSGDCGNGGGELRMGNNNVVADCWIDGQDPNKINPAGHAFTHFVEMSTFKDHPYSSWWIEGTANHFEWFLAAAIRESVEEYTYGIAGSKNIWDEQDIFKVPEYPSADDFNRMFKLLHQGGVEGNWKFGYYLGSLCVEALVATYGVDVVLNNFNLVGELGFEKAFQISFGLSTAEFQKKVLPYVMARHKLDSELMASVQ